jgi:fimbrial chaperone protein
MPTNIVRPFAAALLAAGLVTPAFAGLFSVTPVRIFMSPKDRATAVTITNESDDELVMQADVYQWSQKPAGDDDLVLSEDLVLSPPILKLAPKARQVVRLALVRPLQGSRQATYRMIVREIPEAKAEAKSVELQVALAFSLPVFITPPGAKRDLVCNAERLAPDALKVSCENTGETYMQPREFAVSTSAGQKIASREGAAYLLPGTRRAIDIKKADGPIPGGKLKLEVSLDDGSARAYELTVPE